MLNDGQKRLDSLRVATGTPAQGTPAPPGWFARAILSSLLLATAAVPARAIEGTDLTEMTLESLMQVSITGASMYEQKLTEAPSADNARLSRTAPPRALTSQTPSRGPVSDGQQSGAISRRPIASSTSTCDEVRTPNLFSIYESSTATTTDEGTKAGKIIRGYVEETLKEARRDYRFRDETERKLRRLQERLKYDFLHTYLPFVQAMAFFSNEFYKIVRQWNPKPFESLRVQQTQIGLQTVSKRLLELEDLVEYEGVEGALSEILLQIMLASKFDPSHMTEMDDSTTIELDQRQEAIEIIKQGRRIDLVSDNFGMAA